MNFRSVPSGFNQILQNICRMVRPAVFIVKLFSSIICINIYFLSSLMVSGKGLLKILRERSGASLIE